MLALTLMSGMLEILDIGARATPEAPVIGSSIHLDFPPDIRLANRCYGFFIPVTEIHVPSLATKLAKYKPLS